MKRRVLAWLVSGILAAALIAGCGSQNVGPAQNTPGGNNEPAATTDGKLTTAQGIITSIDSSKDATADEAGLGEVDSYIATVTFDEEGVIQKCIIDASQTKVNFSATGVVDQASVEKPANTKTKDELKEDYGMGARAEKGEWYVQAGAFAEYCVGKKLDELKGLTLDEEGHLTDANDADLTSSVSIHVKEMIEAIEQAMTTDQVQSEAFDGGDSFKTGQGTDIEVTGTDAAADKDGVAETDTTVASVSVDGSGKILACVLNVAQSKVNFDATGKITSNLTDELKSKQILGNDYGMAARATKGEWYVQANAFAAYAVGKNVADLKGLTLDEEGHLTEQDSDIVDSVSIHVIEFITAIEKAVSNAQ